MPNSPTVGNGAGMRSLRRDSVLIDLAFVACVIATLGFAYLGYSSTLFEQERGNREGILTSIENVVDTFIVTETEKISFFIPVISSENPSQIDLEAMLGEVKSVRSVYNVNKSLVVDRIIYSEHPDKEYLSKIKLTPSQILKDMEFALLHNQTVITTLHSSVATGKYSFSFLFPHKNGILVAEVDLENILSILKKTGLLTAYRNSIVLLVHPVNGQVLYSSDEAAYPFMQFLPPKDELIQVGDSQYYYSAQNMKDIDLRIVILTPRRAFETFAGMMKNYSFVILLSLSILIFIRWYWTKFAVLGPLSSFLQHVKEGAAEKEGSLQVYQEWNILETAYYQAQSRLVQTSANLQASSDFLSKVINAVPAAMLVVDAEAKIVHWNDAAKNLAGWPHDKEILLPDAISLYRCLHDVSGEIMSVLRSHTPFSWRGLSVIENNTASYYDITFSPLLLSGYNGGVVIIQDVTEDMRKDLQLQQSQKMEMIGNLAGGFAHDFNNMLGGISASVEMMGFLIQKPDFDIEKLRKYQELIRESVLRAAEMVQQILTLSRKRELKLSPVNLNTILLNVEQLAERTLLKSVTIEMDLPAEAANINADAARLEQVFLNLVINAAHAMTIMRPEARQEGGAVNISVRRLFSDASFRSRHAGSTSTTYWKVSVADTGVGMSREIIQKIFEPFFTTKREGTGLGLSMVYNIVKHHSGFIDVYSEPGRGSTFSVYLPELAGSFEDSFRAGGDGDNFERGEGGVLIADDDSVMRTVASSFLLDCGYTVWNAADGNECVSIYCGMSDQIGVVLLDMVMPHLSGYEAYQKMKHSNPRVRVILCSGFKQDQRVSQILENGAAGFLQKPYTLTELSREVKKVMEIPEKEESAEL